MKVRELNMKPSFSSEVMGFPSADMKMLWEKIDKLVKDPFPDGKLKKKLKGQHDIYRLRMGNFRILYTFGDEWIRLLTIRRRSEKTYTTGRVDYEEPVFLPDEEEDLLDEAQLNEHKKQKLWSFKEQATKKVPDATPLPRSIEVEWLEELKIPNDYIPDLLHCESEEALLNANVPEKVLSRVMDNLFPRPVDQVLQQPDLVLQAPQDLVKLKQGELQDFLLRLDPRQLKLCDWALKGPTMVKGGPGTGKSTVALYRIRSLLTMPKSTGKETALFTTYTRSLSHFNGQLIDSLLSKQQARRVEVRTIDQLVYEVIKESGFSFQTMPPGYNKNVLERILRTWLPPGRNEFEQNKRLRRIKKLTLSYLLDEFRWVIEGQQVESLDAYLVASRAGRKVGFNKSMREAVWSLYEVYTKELEQGEYVSWETLRQKALDAVKEGMYAKRFDFVIVDEAQDFSPVALALLAELAKEPDGIFFAADVKLSIHTKGQSLHSIHPALQFKGRTRYLKHNYRSTFEIEQAALPLQQSEESEDLGRSDCIHHGPMPLLIRCDAGKEEAVWAARFVRQMSKHLRLKVGACGVLVPKSDVGELVAKALTEQGVPARFFKGRELDISTPEVKVLTLHSAKGLEFPAVVICGLGEGTFPSKETLTEAEFEERSRDYNKLIFVGMTRAMRGLMVIYPNETDNPALERLDTDDWEVMGEIK